MNRPRTSPKKGTARPPAAMAFLWKGIKGLPNERDRGLRQVEVDPQPTRRPAGHPTNENLARHRPLSLDDSMGPERCPPSRLRLLLGLVAFFRSLPFSLGEKSLGSLDGPLHLIRMDLQDLGKAAQ